MKNICTHILYIMLICNCHKNVFGMHSVASTQTDFAAHSVASTQTDLAYDAYNMLDRTVTQDVNQCNIDRARYNAILEDIKNRWDENNEHYDSIIKEFNFCLDCDFSSCLIALREMMHIIQVNYDDDMLKSKYFWKFLEYIHKYAFVENRWCISTQEIEEPEIIAFQIMGIEIDDDIEQDIIQLDEPLRSKTILMHKIATYLLSVEKDIAQLRRPLRNKTIIMHKIAAYLASQNIEQYVCACTLK